MEFAKVGTGSFAALGLGAAFGFLLPIAVALIWVIRKKEKFSTVLVGAVIFLLFVTILEKPLQALVITGDHAVSRFLDANPVWWALVVGLFPGVFEETGRLFAFKTILKKRKNRETAVSYGIGHGGAEVLMLLGVNFIAYFAYAVMINSGSFGAVVEQAAAKAPEQVDALYTLADQIANLTVAGVGAALFERVFAFLFHLGASILVFYACRDRGRFWLYPLAILLHTALDFAAGLWQAGALPLSTWGLEAVVAVFGLLTFCGAYFLLYRKDTGAELPEA